MRFNSEWMNAMTPADFVRLCSKYTVARLLERDDFAQRYKSGTPIFAHEFLYPFVQAYDSVALEADVELGGSDQTFNLLMAREIQRDYGQPPQAVITHRLLVGTDGTEKMSKSLGNSIGITDPPEEMYGKVMSIPDAQMAEYFDVLSSGEWESDRASFTVAPADPMASKHRLASLIVGRICGPEGAAAGEAHFRRVVQEKGVPEDVPTHSVAVGSDGNAALLDVLVELGLTKSKGEGRRLIKQGAVSIDGERIQDDSLALSPGQCLVRVGKRRYVDLTVEA